MTDRKLACGPEQSFSAPVFYSPAPSPTGRRGQKIDHMPRALAGNPKEKILMRALCWHGKEDIRCDRVPDPGIEHPRDAIVRVTSTAICGSDLHLYDAFIPGM